MPDEYVEPAPTEPEPEQQAMTYGEEPPAEPEPTEEPVPEVEHHDPGTFVGLDASGSGIYEYKEIGEAAAKKARNLQIDGVDYEHVSTDNDGVWLFRAPGE